MDVFICEVRGDKWLKNIQLSSISLLERVLIQASQFTHFQAYQEQIQCNCIQAFLRYWLFKSIGYFFV